MGEQPLKGLHIVNTRAPHQAGELTKLLEAEGANVLSYPAINIVPVPDQSALDEALNAAVDGAFDWLVITSSNTVQVLARRLEELGYQAESLAEVRIAAIGDATAEAVTAAWGLTVDVLPEAFVAESLADAIPIQRGDRVFLPQSALARTVLAERLTEAGAEVTAVAAYHTIVGNGGVPLPEYFWRGEVDVVTFTSASTVHSFMRRLKRENGSNGMLVDVIVACIGPVTADAARAHDLPVKVVASTHTLEGLVAALVAYVKEQKQ